MHYVKKAQGNISAATLKPTAAKTIKPSVQINCLVADEALDESQIPNFSTQPQSKVSVHQSIQKPRSFETRPFLTSSSQQSSVSRSQN
jgi:hypothetical protein